MKNKNSTYMYMYLSNMQNFWIWAPLKPLFEIKQLTSHTGNIIFFTLGLLAGKLVQLKCPHPHLQVNFNLYSVPRIITLKFRRICRLEQMLMFLYRNHSLKMDEDIHVDDGHKIKTSKFLQPNKKIQYNVKQSFSLGG